jgi:hypothetical protein
MSNSLNVHACFYITFISIPIVRKLVLAWDQVICPLLPLVRLLSVFISYILTYASKFYGRIGTANEIYQNNIQIWNT